MSETTIFIIFIIAFFVIRFLLKYKNELNADKEELKSLNMEVKYRVLINGLNEYCYRGLGKVIKFKNKRSLNLYKQGSCQLVRIHYEVGILKVEWKFKYFHQEMVYRKNLANARDIDEEWQLNALKILISEFLEHYKVHEAKVDSSGIVGKKLSEFGISEENYQKAKDFLNQV